MAADGNQVGVERDGAEEGGDLALYCSGADGWRQLRAPPTLCRHVSSSLAGQETLHPNPQLVSIVTRPDSVHAAFGLVREPSKMTGSASKDRLVLYRKLGVSLGWIEDTTLAERRGFEIRRVDLKAIVRVRLVPNRVGGMYLEAEDREAHQVGCHLLVIGPAGERHVSPEALDRIRTALAQSSAWSAKMVCERLDDQARYLRTGSEVSGSPLRTHSEWVRSDVPEQEVALPGWANPFATVRRDDPRAPKAVVRASITAAGPPYHLLAIGAICTAIGAVSLLLVRASGAALPGASAGRLLGAGWFFVGLGGLLILKFLWQVRPGRPKRP